MTRGGVTTEERTVIAACAIGAVATTIAMPLLWRWVLDHSHGLSIDATMWVGTVLAPLPACLALVAVVLTARAPVGTLIAVGCGIVTLIVDLQHFRSVLGAEDYLTWLAWAVVFGCCLLGADALAWRLGAFTMATGALAGLAVAVLQTVVKLAMYVAGTYGFSLQGIEIDFWLREYAVPSTFLVIAGVLAGSVAQRRGVPQVTAGRA